MGGWFGDNRHRIVNLLQFFRTKVCCLNSYVFCLLAVFLVLYYAKLELYIGNFEPEPSYENLACFVKKLQKFMLNRLFSSRGFCY